MRTPVLPETVRRKLDAMGETGARWRAALPGVIDDLATRWSLRTGRSLDGGSEALVLLTDATDGTRGVLKLGIPGETGFEREVRTLMAANGRGYARVLAHDLSIRAVLLERLGPRLDQLGLPIDEQMEHLCATMRVAWTTPTAALDLMNGAEKARWLERFIVDLWEQLGRPCSERSIDRTLGYAESRARAHDPQSVVLVHGDAHGANTLRSEDGSGGFRFVDPDGLIAEPACDLASPMRDWSEALLAGDALALGQARCETLSRLTGVPTTPIWQWGYLERMSTGLYLIQLGWTDEGRGMLEVADLWSLAS